MTQTPHLGLPLVAPQQAQPHLPHNEALTDLDALVQLAVKDRDRASPPTTPAEGDRHLVAASPVGDWTGQAAKVALRVAGGWRFFAPKRGWIAWVEAETRLLVFDGAAWVDFLAGVPVQNAPMVGVNATADSTTRFVASAGAALFTHAGAGVQLKVNKNAAADTASLLFQTGFSGRAEIGLAGSDDLKVKVSAGGSTWSEALSVAAATGAVGVGVASPAERLHVAEGLRLSGAAPKLRWVGTGGAANANVWDFYTSGPGNFAQFRAVSDDFASAAVAVNYIRSGASVLRVEFGGPVAPAVDNAYALGAGGQRWSTVFAAAGTINTSDRRDKTALRPLDAETAWALFDALTPFWFRYLEGAVAWREVEDPDEVEERQAVDWVEVEEEAVVVEDGLAHRRTIRRREAVPAFDEVPFADGSGVWRAPRMETVPKRRQERVILAGGARDHLGFMAQDVRAALERLGLDPGRCALWGLVDPADPASRQWLRYDHFHALWHACLTALRGQVVDLARRLEALERA